MSVFWQHEYPGNVTVGYSNIGAAQKQKPAFGYPGIFPGNLCIGFETIGAVQKQPTIFATSSKSTISFIG